MRSGAVKILFALAALLTMSQAVAQGPADLNVRARAIADNLRCPVCRGIPIAESPSELARDMMTVIREKLGQGESDEQILAYFVERYGEWILLQPKAQGLNLMIWILPALLLLAGGTLVLVSVRKWTRKR